MNRLSQVLWLGFAVTASLAAQQLTLGTVTSQYPGHSTTVNVNLTSQGASVAGLQFDLLYDKTNLTITAAAGASSTAAQKSLSNNNNLPGGLRVIDAALNQNIIGDGTVVVLTITAANGAVPGNYSLTFANVSGTDPNATPIAVTATNGSFTVLAPLAISAPATLPTATVATAYSQAVTATGGVTPYSFSATGLPNGLSIAPSTGIISGTPSTNSGSPFSVVVTVNDSSSSTANMTYSLAVNPALVITGPATIPAGTSGSAYAGATITATGGSASYMWSATGLPAGITISPTTGAISGTPTGGASSGNVVVMVTDTNNVVASKTYSLVINGPLTVTGPASLPVGTVGVAYPSSGATVAAAGGSGSYTWSASGLPTGLTIAPTTGLISGTPTTSAGSPFSVVVTATDTTTATATKSYSLTIDPALSITGPASLPVGTVNVLYPNTTVAATGGSGSYTWTATGLPAGLTIASTTGVISGTPTTSTGNPFNVVVTATDSNSVTANKTYSLVIDGAMTVTAPASLPVGTVAATYPSTTATATGGSGTYTWSATGLPNGLSIAPATGIISGSPTTNAGSPLSVVITATDANSVTATKSLSLTVNPALSITGPESLGVGTVNTPYTSTTITATGGSSSYTWSATNLPAGLTIGSSSGTISGTPTSSAGSPFSVVVTATDTNSVKATATYSLTINPALTITAPASLPTGTANSAYTSTTVTATGGNGVYTWSATGLPTGITIGSSSGTISGTPTAGASAGSVVVTVTDGNLVTASKTYSLTINGPPTVTGPVSLPVGTVNAVYPATTITGAGGTGTFTWTATGLPAGLSIASATGIISGTPTTNAGSPYSVVVTSTDGNSITANKTYSLTINSALSISAPATLPLGTANFAYTPTTITATGGSNSYTWTASGLPNGLSIASTTGIISGTPTTNSGSPFNVLVTATDSNSVVATKTYSLTINGALTIAGPGTLPQGTVSSVYPATTVTAAGGSSSYSFSATGLPAGLTIAPNGAITGTPTTNVGSPFSVIVTVTDTNSATATKTYSLVVNGPLTVSGPASLNVATVNNPYAATTVTANGGSGSYTFSASGFPSGMAIASSTGIISGTPTTNAGTPYSVTVTVTDTNQATATKSYSLTVDPALVITGPASLPLGVVNVAFTATTVAATGGNSTYTWTATGLPAGLSIGSTTGTISGTPTTNTGSPFSVVVTVTDSTMAATSKTYSLTINAALVVSTASLPVATVNATYSTTVAATGGIGPYSWAATGLPNGLTIAAGTGVISGSPTTNTGSPFSVQVSVTDNTATTVNRTVSLTVDPALTVTTPTITVIGTDNSPLPTITIAAAGGSGTYTFSATGLPPGVTISPTTGVISGTPTSNAGSPYSITVTATDSNQVVASRTYSFTINPALVISSPGSLALGVITFHYPNTTVTASGGSGTYTFSATGLPTGLSIASATGIISGTPTVSSTAPYVVIITVTDSNSASSTRTYALQINGALSIATQTLSGVTIGSPYSNTLVATGGTGVYTWSATGVPPGLSLSASGQISGTATGTANSTASISATVTDTNGSTAKMTFVVQVSLPPSNIPPVVLSGPFVLPTGTVNQSYPGATVSAQGGTPPYTFSSTNLPAGLTLNPTTGAISGTPTTATNGIYNLTVTATDSTNSGVTGGYNIAIIGSTLTVSAPTSLPGGNVGSPYTATAFTATGGAQPYTWSATGLPAGLSIGSSTGAITGTPTTSTGSPFAVQITVTDSTGAKANRSYSLTVSGGLSITGPSSLPTATVNVVYPGATIVAAGGSGSYTWSATGLPGGMTIGAATGVIAGTPTSSAGSPVTVVVTVTDSTGATATMSFTLTVNTSTANLPTISAVSNSAAGTVTALAPGAWVSIYGANFAAAGFTDTWSKTIVNGQFPTVLDGVSVTAGGQKAYISYLSPTQINVLLPSITFGSMQLTVTTPAGVSSSFTFTSQQYSPAFFPWPNNQPVATHADYSLAAKNGSITGVTTIPARPGETIILWCEGFGPTNPPTPAGVATPTSATYYTATSATVTINGLSASVMGVALAPGYGGLYQLVITVPTPLANGDYTVIASIGGVQTPAATLTVQN